MATDRTTEKLERERAVLEADYREALIAALRECASGRWGLLKQSSRLLPKSLEQRMVPPSVLRLEAVGEELALTRARLGFVEPFVLMASFATLRREAIGNQLGEPRLADAFLKRLQKEQQA